MNRQPSPTCRMVRPQPAFTGKQGLDYAVGIAAESVGARGIHMQLITIPPGARARAHKHVAHETALYALSGVSGVWYGDALEHHALVRPGSFFYIPADVPHLPYNPSDTEQVVVVASRTDPNEQESVELLPALDARRPAGFEAGWRSFAGTIVKPLVQASGDDNGFFLVETRKPPGSMTPVHRHAHESETVYVLDGELSVQTGHGLRRLGAGDAATLPVGGTHRLANLSDAEVCYLLLGRSGSFDRMLQALSVPGMLGAFGPAEREALVEAAPRHGITLLPDAALDAPHAAARLETSAAPERLDLVGIDLEVLSAPPDAVGPVLLRATFPPGAMVPLHSHAEPESFYVLQGVLSIYRAGDGDGWTDAAPGALVVVDSHVRHAVRCVGPAPAVVLTVTDPGLLTFFRAAARPPGTPPGPPDQQEIAALMQTGRRMGGWFGGPEDDAAIGGPS